jgi:anionic cell wall polymer biosynthesis LytR-Cps2A-Psr (LCP) family protein
MKTSIGRIRHYYAVKTDDILRIHRQQSAIKEVMKISPQK